MAIGPSAGVDRRQILQGVYEDNLRTKLNQPARSPKRRSLKKQPLQEQTARSRLTVAVTMALIAVMAFVYGVTPFSRSGQAAGAENQVSADAIPSARIATVVDDRKAQPSGDDLRVASLYGLTVKTIVIDAGHGGIDPGTMGQLGTKEKDLTLDVARRLKVRLERNYGYRVLMTRTEDKKVSLRERVTFANTHAADLFISLHVNWLPGKPRSVIETYYFGPKAEGSALELARRENEDSEYTVAEFNEMLTFIGGTIKLQESERLARAIQKSLYSNVSRLNEDVDNWGVKEAPFVVLLGVNAPSVLAEIACLNDPEEENRLNDGNYREKLAIFLEEGILDYLQQPDEHDPTDGDTRYAASSKEEDQVRR